MVESEIGPLPASSLVRQIGNTTYSNVTRSKVANRPPSWCKKGFFVCLVQRYVICESSASCLDRVASHLMCPYGVRALLMCALIENRLH